MKRKLTEEEIKEMERKEEAQFDEYEDIIIEPTDTMADYAKKVLADGPYFKKKKN